MSDDKRPYGADAQIYTFGIHGTENNPSNVKNITNIIRQELDYTTKGASLADSSFDWTSRSHLTHRTPQREEASWDLTKHVVGKIKEAINNGSLDPNKALTVNLAGFSHGGNVALLASDDIAHKLKADPQTANMRIAMHVTTLSTPAYTEGTESPDTAKSKMPKGVKFDHTHFSTTGDPVAGLGSGHSNYWSNTTHNVPQLPAVAPIGHTANHGALQDDYPTMDSAAQRLSERFNGLRNLYKSDVGNDNVVASATHEIQPNSAQSLEFKNNPRVQEIYAALDRNGENQTPSLVAGLAGAAANLSKVQDVVLTPQTAFALDRDKFDPAANRASVSMDVANKPFDEVWKTASVALQQTQSPAVVAQGQDLEQKQSARTM